MITVLFGLLLCFRFSFCQPPIPPWKLGDGFSLGEPSDAIIELEHVLDLCCPDCQAFYLQTMPEIVSYYFSNKTRVSPNDPSGPGDLYLRVHFIALPYHVTSYLMTKAAVIVQKSKSPSVDWFTWITNVFKNQNVIENDQVQKLDQAGIIDLIYTSFFKPFGFDQDNFTKLMSDTDIEGLARYKFKFSTSRGVYGTPSFFVNGVKYPGPDDYTQFSQWKKMFDDLKKQINENLC